MDNDQDQVLPVTNTDMPGRSTRGGRRRGAGRKPIRIDLELIERLSAMGCTNDEIAGACRCSVRTLETYLKKPEFAMAKACGLARAQISIRRNQFKAAEKGDVRMLIFLGKQFLAQQDPPTDGYAPGSFGRSRLPLPRLGVEHAVERQRQVKNVNAPEPFGASDEAALRRMLRR